MEFHILMVRFQEPIINEYRSSLDALLGEKLDSVILYGSRARGDARDDSDIDLLCVIKGDFTHGDLIKQTSELTSRISLKYGVAISRTFVSLKDMQNRNNPFLMNIRREGVAV